MLDYTKIDKKVDKIVSEVIKYNTFLDAETIKTEIYKAYIYAREAHGEQVRLSGGPYIEHPVEATLILLGLKPDIHTIQACLMHDVIEDTPNSMEDIRNIFGDDVAFLCEGVSKLSHIRYKGEERDLGSLRKMFIAMAEDLRVVFIKLSDRLHNMQTLKHHPKPEKRTRIALETLNIYVPIADRLGLYHIKNGLEEQCFSVLESHDYKKLKKELKDLNKSMMSFSKSAEKEIKKVLDEAGIRGYEIDNRIKSIYSIYKKIQKKGLDSAASLYDLFGIRIIVKDEATCYKTLGIIHKLWTPLPNRFKDYIALPKPNGYRSLHTTVIGLLKDFRKQPTEIQIKTYEMKYHSDIGIAAHFEYKEKGSKVAEDINWVKELKELTENLENNDFMNSLKVDVFRDRIFVFTPKGDLINLPAGSTPIDFAYYVHSDLGDHISVVKINGVIKTLDKDLHNGDVIDIIVDKNKKPNPFRLSFVKTSKAKNRIKSYLKKDNKETFRDRGREILNKYLEKSSILLLDKDLSLLKVLDNREYSLEERYQLLEQIGSFTLTPASLIRRIFKNRSLDKQKQVDEKAVDKNIQSSDVKQEIIIGGESGLKYRVLSCCKNKNLTEKIVAHINNKGIITIHKRDCPVLKTVNKDRLLQAYVAGNENDNIHVDIIFTVKNKKGILKSISDIIYIMDINIEQIYFKKSMLDVGDIVLTLEIPDYDYLIIDRLIERVKNKLKSDLLSSRVKNIDE